MQLANMALIRTIRNVISILKKWVSVRKKKKRKETLDMK